MGDYSEACAGNRRSYSGQGGGSGTAFADAPIEIGSIVRDGITANEQTLTEVHNAISRLENRLETVLSPMPPAADPGRSGATPVGPPCSHVTGRLGTLNDTGRQALSRLEELLRRVEV